MPPPLGKWRVSLLARALPPPEGGGVSEGGRSYPLLPSVWHDLQACSRGFLGDRRLLFILRKVRDAGGYYPPLSQTAGEAGARIPDRRPHCPAYTPAVEGNRQVVGSEATTLRGG